MSDVGTYEDIEADSHLEYLRWLEEKRRSHYTLEEVLKALPPDTWMPLPILGLDGPALSADGMVWFTLVFKDSRERARFLRNFSGTWIIAGDRACFMSYSNTWKDVNGWGLTLCPSDYPVRALGGVRNSELRTFIRCGRK